MDKFIWKKLKQKIKKNKRREKIKRKLIIKKNRRGIEKNKEKQTPKWKNGKINKKEKGTWMGRKNYVPRLGLRKNIRKVCGLLALVCARGLRSTGAVQCFFRRGMLVVHSLNFLFLNYHFHRDILSDLSLTTRAHDLKLCRQMCNPILMIYFYTNFIL
jgi:hypothetical protein